MFNYHQDGVLPPLKTKNLIFVFGSNLSGRHGAGAALAAKLHFGAQYGIGSGRTGNSYAIPTKDAHKDLHVLPLDEIKSGVDLFISYATKNTNLQFFITRIGCNLAHYKNSDIAPMFSNCPSNCLMPEPCRDYLLNPSVINQYT